jgi:hypothetical protein
MVGTMEYDTLTFTDETPLTTLLTTTLASVLGFVAILVAHYHFFQMQGPKRPKEDGEDLLPPKKIIVTNPIRLSTLKWIAESMPLCGMWLGLVISLHYHPNVTATQCAGYPPEEFPTNWMPSISAIIGNNFPEVAIWRVAVVMQQWGRVFATVAVYNHFDVVLGGSADATNRLHAWLQVFEQAGLVLLTAVSSTDHALFHELAFFVYFTAHGLSMLALITMGQWYVDQETASVRQGNAPNSIQLLKYSEKALTLRKRIAMFNFGSFLCFIFFFITSQGSKNDAWSMCAVNGWYSMFGVFEWCYVWSSCFFHWVEHVDLYYVEVKWGNAAVVGGDRRGQVEGKNLRP